MLANLVLAGGAIMIGLRTRQGSRFWLSVLLAVGVQRTAAVAFTPLYRSARAVADATGNPTPALWVATGLVLLAWVAPALIIRLGFRRAQR
jgi:hypothetical protein